MISGGATALPRPKPSGRPWPVTITDAAPAAGLNFRYTYGDPQKKKYVIEANGAGVAMLDYDNDGRLDLYLVNGTRLEGASAGAAPTNHLFRNTGHGKFTDVTQTAHLNQSGWGNGVCAGDYDNDGHTDLYVTYYGRNLLQHNNGDGTFTDQAAHASVAGSGREWSTGCTFVDYDRDGHLDLLVTRYLNYEQAATPLPGSHPFCMWKGSPVYCGPRGLPFGSLAFYHNRGDGTFEDATAASGIGALKGFYAFTTVATDFDGDGWPDLYVACDSTPSMLFHNQKNGTFREIGTETGLAYNDNGSEQAGMGLSVGDFDNDGRLDILKTNFTGDYPNLYRNIGRGLFTDICLRAGLAVNPDHVLWGTAFADLDNDGWPDILQVSGHVYPEVAQIDAREHYQRPRIVYRNLGNGRFEDVSELSGPGIAAPHSSRGLAIGDFDNDGALDALVMNMHEAPSLLHNTLKSTNHWLKLRLRGTTSNRDAIGAVVTVQSEGRRQAAAVLSQSSFLSHHDLRLHFGLGAADKSGPITVQWPSGKTEQFPAVAANALYLLTEGSGEAKPQELPQ